MNDIEIILARHEQQLNTLEREVSELKQVQKEIRSMNENLITLATELKNTNSALARHEKKLDEIDSVPKMRIQQIASALIAAIAGGAVSLLLSILVR